MSLCYILKNVFSCFYLYGFHVFIQLRINKEIIRIFVYSFIYCIPKCNSIFLAQQYLSRLQQFLMLGDMATINCI